jgi:type III secretion system YscQ/HrcQ family protein
MTTRPRSMGTSRQTAAPGLKRVEPAWARVANRLLVHSAHSQLQIDGSPARWHWHALDSEAAAGALNLVLACGEARCAITLHSDGLGLCDDTIELSAFDGMARRQAAALRHAALIDHLDSLTSRQWEVAELDSPSFQEAGLRVAFTVQAESGSQAPTRGELCIAPSGLEAWNDVAGEAVDASAALAAAPIAFDVLVGDEVPLPREELRSLRPGGAILLQRVLSGGALPCVLRQASGAVHALADLHGERVVLRSGLRPGSPAHPSDSRSSPMPTNVDPLADGNDEATRAALESLPVTLDFCVARLDVPMAELAAGLAPGRVFELGQTLGPESVSVRAGGVELARGELIELGDRLAVRITRLASHGPV